VFSDSEAATTLLSVQVIAEPLRVYVNATESPAETLEARLKLKELVEVPEEVMFLETEFTDIEKPTVEGVPDNVQLTVIVTVLEPGVALNAVSVVSTTGPTAAEADVAPPLVSIQR
jgi:hypothetical protein